MAGAVSIRSSVVASGDQVSSNLGGEVAILDVEAGMYYGLDEVGARVWTLIQSPKTVDEVLQVLLDEYEVEPGRCEQDLISLLQSMADEGLIEVARETTPA
jgi:hypothetical protein